MKERVLITGASGFVGFHLIEAAIKDGMEVFAAVRAQSKTDHLKALPVHYITLDLSDQAALVKTLEAHQFDYIIHGAGLTKAKTQQDYDLVNASFSKNLAEAALAVDIPLKRFVLISSLAALGPLNDTQGSVITPEHLPHPVTGYGRSKLLAEQYLGRMEELPLVVLRPTAVYGPREKDIYIIIRSVARGIEPYIGRNDQRLSFIYVKDLAAVAVKALHLEGKEHVCYNVSDGKVYSRYDLADITKQVLGKKAFRFHLPVGLVRFIAVLLESAFRFSKVTPALNKEKLNELTALNWSCCIDGLKKDMNFVPQYDLAKGMEETIGWYRQNGWL